MNEARDEHRLKLLEDLYRKGISSPMGARWHEFYVHLQSKSRSSKPPVPLILAASGASAKAKHDRLSQQLEWAISHGCFEDAVSWLNAMSCSDWEYCELENWNREYWA